MIRPIELKLSIRKGEKDIPLRERRHADGETTFTTLCYEDKKQLNRIENMLKKIMRSE